MSVQFFLIVLLSYFSAAFSTVDDIYKKRNSDEYVPCLSGWYYFRNKCYKAAGRSLPDQFTWTRAVDLCRGYGGELISIHSQEEQNFVVAYLQLDVKWWSWIGLNDRDEEGNYKWSDGSVLNYTDWKPNQPSGLGDDGEEEDCVHITFDVHEDTIGKWNDRSCDIWEYALCEMKADHTKKSPNLLYCSPQEGGGWKYQNSCYHIVMQTMSWRDAENHCKNNYNGHLLTIQDTLEDLFLELALPDIQQEIWIGIKLKDQLQQKWTSGWFVSYERFSKEETFVEDTCVARKSRSEWLTLPCLKPLSFICKVSKATPPVLKPAPASFHCPKELDGWRDFGGDYCYYIETKNILNFYEANLDCQRRGANVVSLHSKAEVDILHPFLKYNGEAIHIGLIRLKENNEEAFGWTDGSIFDYKNWDHKEPNKLEEKCVEALTTTMKWRDSHCDQKKLGYICSVKKISSSSFADESTNCDSFCIPKKTYLHGLVSQCTEATRILCNSR